MPLREYEAFIRDWQEEDRSIAYRNASLIATIMNQNPYRTSPVSVDDLLGENTVAPEGSDNALRDALKFAGKTKGGNHNGQ